MENAHITGVFDCSLVLSAALGQLLPDLVSGDHRRSDGLRYCWLMSLILPVFLLDALSHATVRPGVTPPPPLSCYHKAGCHPAPSSLMLHATRPGGHKATGADHLKWPAVPCGHLKKEIIKYKQGNRIWQKFKQLLHCISSINPFNLSGHKYLKTIRLDSLQDKR